LTRRNSDFIGRAENNVRIELSRWDAVVMSIVRSDPTSD